MKYTQNLTAFNAKTTKTTKNLCCCNILLLVLNTVVNIYCSRRGEKNSEKYRNFICYNLDPSLAFVLRK